MSERKQVPVQPTQEMIEAGFDAIPGLLEERIRAQWPQPRPMSEAPKQSDAWPPKKILVWWPDSKEWVATWWWSDRGTWIHALLETDEQQPTHWLPMPPEPTKQEVTK